MWSPECGISNSGLTVPNFEGSDFRIMVFMSYRVFLRLKELFFFSQRRPSIPPLAGLRTGRECREKVTLRKFATKTHNKPQKMDIILSCINDRVQDQ
jgi:hypothetical protein